MELTQEWFKELSFSSTHLPPVWDVLLPLAQTPDGSDQRPVVFHPKDRQCGVNELAQVWTRCSNHWATTPHRRYKVSDGESQVLHLI